jgi:hypothetical protein
MATPDYDPADGHPSARAAGSRRERSVGEHVFIWLAWALAAAFWGASMTTFVGILQAAAQPAPALASGAADVGGSGFLLMTVAAATLLGAALAYGMIRSNQSDPRRAPATEARTAELYDSIERQGGEDLTALSPEREREIRRRT